MLGARVKTLREKNGWSQNDLAARTGITQATISRLENGHVQELRLDGLQSLADEFQVSIDYLIGRTKQLEALPSVQLDPDLNDLVECYRILSQQKRERLRHMTVLLILEQYSGGLCKNCRQRVEGNIRSAEPEVENPSSIVRMLLEVLGSSD